MKNLTMIQTGILTLSLLTTSVMAAVSQQEADQLGTTLTPLGAQKEGNADGSIPAWTGGLKPGAAPITNGFLGNPLEADKPQFVITAANAQQYKDKLTAGQLAMFQRYPDTYRIPVYPTRRTAASSQKIYDAAKKSALTVEETNDGNGLKNFDQSRAYAFPIPKSGVEVVWNHITRYRGGSNTQQQIQATPQVNGSYSLINVETETAYPDNMSDVSPKDSANILYYIKQTITAPARLAGNVTLIHETIDQVVDPRKAWTYAAGQRRVRRAPQVAYDGPAAGADGLRVGDQNDTFNGAPDRYDWKLVGKKEMYIPYNNFQLASPKVKYADIIKPGHINQDLTRYELHRVWHVVATLKNGQRHVYSKRDMYFDEDTWMAVEADLYDGRGQLWRVQEGYAVNDYEHGMAMYAVNATYDLLAGRYIASNMQNENKTGLRTPLTASMNAFTPSALRNDGVR